MYKKTVCLAGFPELARGMLSRKVSHERSCINRSPSL